MIALLNAEHFQLHYMLKRRNKNGKQLNIYIKSFNSCQHSGVTRLLTLRSPSSGDLSLAALAAGRWAFLVRDGTMAALLLFVFSVFAVVVTDA